MSKKSDGGKPVHTVPSPKGKGWDNKVAGEVQSHHHTKEKAVEKGKDIAKKNEGEHVIHKKDGKIGEKNSYGPDPVPPKDKK